MNPSSVLAGCASCGERPGAAEGYRCACLREVEAARVWDSESRQSPFSTVADPADESYCEGCGQPVVDDGSRHGRCGCSRDDG